MPIIKKVKKLHLGLINYDRIDSGNQVRSWVRSFQEKIQGFARYLKFA